MIIRYGNDDHKYNYNFSGDVVYHPPTLGRFKDNFWWKFNKNKDDGDDDVRPVEADHSIQIVLALIFTSTCGVMEGANLSGDLKNPAKSLPLGTLCAKCTSCTTYMLFATFLAACFDWKVLQCEYLVLQKQAVSQYFIVVGIAMACLSTALGALFGAARILQAMARDKILPLGYFAKGSAIGDEPRRAVILTFLIANIFAYFGKNSINGLSQILTDFFLTAYAYRIKAFNPTPMGVDSISPGSPHARPMGVHRTCGEPNEIKKNTQPEKHYRSFP